MKPHISSFYEVREILGSPAAFETPRHQAWHDTRWDEFVVSSIHLLAGLAKVFFSAFKLGDERERHTFNALNTKRMCEEG